MASPGHVDGLDALRTALLKLPAELVHQASVIVHAQADYAYAEIARTYPYRTGNLRDHLSVEKAADGVSATGRVKSTARHAWLFEHGSTVRQWKNGKVTGSMPASGTFVPIVMRRRQIMKAALVDLVERAGLTVTAPSA